MSKCCVIKAINIVNAGSGSGVSLNTIYSADATLVGNRVVTSSGSNLTFNMGSDTFTVSGVATTKGVTLAAQSTNPGGSGTLWESGINVYLGNEPLSLLPVAVESTGTFTAALNYLTPVNVSGAAATVSPPTPIGVNSRFELVDSRGRSATNNITVNFSGAGQRLYGSTTENYTMNGSGAFAGFRYLGATIGWIVER